MLTNRLLGFQKTAHELRSTSYNPPSSKRRDIDRLITEATRLFELLQAKEVDVVTSESHSDNSAMLKYEINLPKQDIRIRTSHPGNCFNVGQENKLVKLDRRT
ncbi:Uncharacterised protein [Yersinia kristensenii]|uniref:Uncharacterized protein n=1 Tax=Yersinia kristensenii TaxID=28152 RepID=A0A0T9L3G8_YERKR|nr:Uncharacterised protein [Yersinia kristensenii]